MLRESGKIWLFKGNCAALTAGRLLFPTVRIRFVKSICDRRTVLISASLMLAFRAKVSAGRINGERDLSAASSMRSFSATSKALPGGSGTVSFRCFPRLSSLRRRSPRLPMMPRRMPTSSLMDFGGCFLFQPGNHLMGDRIFLALRGSIHRNLCFHRWELSSGGIQSFHLASFEFTASQH
jgi:hypothetical protein